MNWVAVFLMLLSLLLARRVFRDWRNPGVLFALAWFVGCLLVALVGDITFGISMAAALTYFGTVLLFNLGVLLCLGGRRYGGTFSAPDWLRSREISAIISAGTVLVVVLTPYYFSEAVGVLGLDDIALRLVETCAEQVELSGITGSFSLLNNLPVLAQAMAMLAALGIERRWTAWARLLVLSACWSVLGLSTGSKLVAVQVPVIVLICIAMSRRQIPVAGMAIALISAIGLFTVGVVVINFGYLIRSGALLDIDAIPHLVVSYFLGGLVGFSELLEQGLYPYWPQNALRSVLYTLNAVSSAIGLGDVSDIGYQHAPFILLGPGIEGNVYTAIFSYYATGEWVGVLLWPVVAGMLCGWAYRGMHSGWTWALVSVPVLYYGVLASVYSEQIFGSFLILVKLLLVVGGIRMAVDQVRRFRAAALEQRIQR